MQLLFFSVDFPTICDVTLRDSQLFLSSSQFFVYLINSIPSHKEVPQVGFAFLGGRFKCYSIYVLCSQGKPQDRVAGGKEEYNAFFYSLVSTDTQVTSAF